MAKKLEFIKGKRYGLLTALSISKEVYYTKNGNRKYGQLWVFKCDCGGEKTTLANNVCRGFVSSCGCLKGKGYLKSIKFIDYTNKKFGSLTEAAHEKRPI